MGQEDGNKGRPIGRTEEGKKKDGDREQEEEQVRINVYAEEITTETELVKKEVYDEKFGARTFYGLRLFLASPDVLHSDPADDDRSAITFWIAWTRKGGHDFQPMGEALDNLYSELILAREEVQGPGWDDLPDALQQVDRQQDEDDDPKRDEEIRGGDGEVSE